MNKFDKWKIDRGQDSTEWDYIAENFQIEDIIILSKLFMPETIEKNGMIFLKDNFSEKGYKEWFYHFNGNRRDIEQMINHVHLYDNIGFYEQNIDEESLVKLGAILTEMWSIYFEKQLPNKNIKVEFTNSEEDYGPTIYVYQDW